MIVSTLVTIVVAAVSIFIALSGKDEAGATVVYEPPLAPGPDPFTPPVDVPASSVGALIPTPTPSLQTATPTPGQTPTVAPGNFGGTGTTVCDRELLIRQLQSNPAALRAWASVRRITPDAVPAYIRALRPSTLARDTRVTNHSFKGGKAVAFQSIQPAGSAVLVDLTDRVVARCRCGNPLLEAEPIGTGSCKGCPAGYRPPAILPRGQTPEVVTVINPPAVAGASPSPTPTTEATNLSVGATAVASQTYSADYPARFGVDDDPRTSWFSKGPEAPSNTSTYTITLARPSTITRIEFVDNSANTDPAVRNGFGFRSWKIELLDASGNLIATAGPASDPTKSQTLTLTVAGVSQARFVGSGHQDPTCGGFGALWLFGTPT